MKQLIEQTAITLAPFYPDRDQSIDAFLQDITKELTELKNLHYSTDIVCDKLYTNHYGYDGAFNISVSFYRLETDQEEYAREQQERAYNERKERKRLARLEKKQAQQTAKVAAERAEYERLKAKYGE